MPVCVHAVPSFFYIYIMHFTRHPHFPTCNIKKLKGALVWGYPKIQLHCGYIIIYYVAVRIPGRVFPQCERVGASSTWSSPQMPFHTQRTRGLEGHECASACAWQHCHETFCCIPTQTSEQVSKTIQYSKSQDWLTTLKFTQNWQARKLHWVQGDDNCTRQSCI